MSKNPNLQGWFFVLMLGAIVSVRQGQDFFQIQATSPETIAYALAYARGEAAPLAPSHCSLSNPTPDESKLCAADTHIISVQDCRSGQCTRVRGLYSGRSPN